MGIKKALLLASVIFTAALGAGGTLTDPRDGQKYRTVTIGGATWMAQNLNFKAKGSYCYGAADSNCVKYGRLYDWNTAGSACPIGWHLPDTAEWNELVSALVGGWEFAGSKLKSVSGWNPSNGWNPSRRIDGDGVDEFGFSALPGGYRFHGGDFYNAGYYAIWWSATEHGTHESYYRYLGYNSHSAPGNPHNFKSDGRSVRCVLDGGAAAEPARHAAAPPPTAADRRSFTDSRDNRKYRAVKIGDQVWMAENLSFKADSSYCYDNKESNCAKYGRLYNWHSAMGACPSGWRLPKTEEWYDLMEAVGGVGYRISENNSGYHDRGAGAKLKSKTGWARGLARDYRDDKPESVTGVGTDDYGFSALPGGERDDRGGFRYAGREGRWWSSERYSRSHSAASFFEMSSNHDIGEKSLNPLSYAYSVRCIQDTAASGAPSARKTAAKPPTAADRQTLTDSRDKRKYRAVKIGDQVWMAENLSYKTGASYCYGGADSNCVKYGRLYTWQTAIKACPPGWRLPGRGEWDSLLSAVGGTRDSAYPDHSFYDASGKTLKSSAGWENRKYGTSGSGTDEFGFSALPGGHRSVYGDYYGVGLGGTWWSAAEKRGGFAYYRDMSSENDAVDEGGDSKDNGHSVRCVKE